MSNTQYDAIIIGGGIAGVSLAYWLAHFQQRVLLFDERGIAGGGSGAAGAFINPKVSIGGALMQLVNLAHAFSHDFYATEFADYFHPFSLLHLAKDDQDKERIAAFVKEHGDSNACLQSFSHLHEHLQNRAHVCIAQSGVVDAQPMCQALATNATLRQERVTSVELMHSNSVAVQSTEGHYVAKTLFLATGAYDKALLPQPYIALRKVTGSRISLRNQTPLRSAIHHHVSIAPLNKELIIGATHHIVDNDSTSISQEQEIETLLFKANQSMYISDAQITSYKMALRSGSNDYLPMVGPLVDMEAVKQLPLSLRKKDAASQQLPHYPNVFMLNGVGGYGFVLAPYLARMLVRHLHENEALNTALLPERFFWRFMRKNSASL